MARVLLIVALALLWDGPVLAAGESYALEVRGLACPFCAYGIEKRLRAIDGVADVEIDIAGGRVIVSMKEGMRLGRDAAEQAIREAGFTLGGFTELEKSSSE